MKFMRFEAQALIALCATICTQNAVSCAQSSSFLEKSTSLQKDYEAQYESLLKDSPNYRLVYQDIKPDYESTKRIYTIDREEAVGLDDAISIVVKNQFEIQVGLHIIDVANIVTVDSPLDIKAYRNKQSTNLKKFWTIQK